jgi:hypothetical protein
VQLEEVLCAGREVLHGYLVSQAMSMACESDGWLAWLLPGGLGTYLDTKRVAANGETERLCTCGG